MIVRRGAALLAALLLALAGCGSPAPSQDTHPAPGLLVIPASGHVSGNYPSVCARAIGSDTKLPVRGCTPGSIRSDVTQDSIGKTICVRGWTATVRPPQAETDPVKTAAMTAYGVPESQRSVTELDHLVPIELGGSNDVSNLWAQLSDFPGAGFRNTKDTVENTLKTEVCDHKVTLASAQKAIATDWETAERNVGRTR